MAKNGGNLMSQNLVTQRSLQKNASMETAPLNAKVIPPGKQKPVKLPTVKSARPVAPPKVRNK